MKLQHSLTFLKHLSNNNSKDWFDFHRSEYELVKKNFIEFTEELIIGISKFDPEVAHLEAKKCTFRINRDVRFSKNKLPYKNHMGATISPGGKKVASAGYYFHLQPGSSYIAGGMWQPETNYLNAIRQEIDYNEEEFKRIINAASFKKYFKGFSAEDRLKTAPKGYDKTHPQIELLKNKSFIVVMEITDKQVLAPGSLKEVLSMYKAMLPLNQFLRRAGE